MPYTPDARWQSRKRCLPGTRSELLHEILEWAGEHETQSPRILLLTGVEGIGKSSAAHTIASSLEDISCLGASYFFNGKSTTHRSALLFPTIARHLTIAVPPFKEAIVSVNDARTFGTMDLDDQFENLLRKPLLGLSFAGPLVIVVDALNDSGSVQGRNRMLTILAERFHELPSNFRLLVTSRPEEDVLRIFDDEKLIRYIEMEVSDPISKNIEAYVASALVDAKGRPLNIFTQRHYVTLAQKAEGLFKWAVDACKTILWQGDGKRRTDTHQMLKIYEDLIHPLATLGTSSDEVQSVPLSDPFPWHESTPNSARPLRFFENATGIARAFEGKVTEQFPVFSHALGLDRGGVVHR